MLMSRHMNSQIDIAMIHAFVDHQFPQLEFSSKKNGQTHTIVIDGFADNQQLDQFAAELKKRTGVQL
jgi:hypothetical protein